MKKILIVLDSLRVGGLEKVAVDCMKYADRKELSFDYLVFDKNIGAYEGEVQRMGARVIRMCHSHNPIMYLINTIKVMKKYGKYDVVHSHVFFSSGIILFAAFCNGVKIRIAHSHSIQRKDSSCIKKITYILLGFLIKNFTTIPCACSRKAGEYLFGKTLFSKKGIIVPNIVEIDRFAFSTFYRKKMREKFGIQPEDVVLGQIGRLSVAKNQLLLLRIYSLYRFKYGNAKLLLVGEGEMRKEIERLADELHIQEGLIMTGTRYDIPSLLSAMDVFVCSSTNEGLGIVLLEAQANGLPCVACVESIVDEIKQLGNCELVSDYNNIEKWVQACRKSINRGRRFETVQQLRKSIFTEKKLKEIIKKLY